MRCDLQAYPLLSRIVKAGGHRGLEECQRLFKSEVWNCTLDSKHVLKELPIFFKTTLPYGKSFLVHLFYVPKQKKMENENCLNLEEEVIPTLKFAISPMPYLVPFLVHVRKPLRDCAIIIRRGGSKTRGGGHNVNSQP